MKTEDWAKGLRASQIKDIAANYDANSLVGIVLTARTNDQRQGPQNRPASVMIDPTHPQWATVVGILSAAVSENVVKADADLAAVMPVISAVK